MCSLCSRLRRGVLYRVAGELGATKIALGHHRDDLLATFFLNLFFGGKLKTMPPKLVSDDGKHVVIRPLAYVRERDLARYADVMAFPLIPVHAVRLAGEPAAQAGRAMLREWEKKFPGRIESIFNALGKVEPSHLMDRRCSDFARGPRHGRAGARRRHRVRRRSGARGGGRGRGRGRGAADVDPARARLTRRPRDPRWTRRRTCAARSPRWRCAAAAGLVAVADAAARRRSRRRSTAGPALLARAARRWLHHLLPPHGDRFRPERRADDRIRGTARRSATSPTAAAPTRARSAPSSAPRTPDRRGAREPVLPDDGNRDS